MICPLWAAALVQGPSAPYLTASASQSGLFVYIEMKSEKAIRREFEQSVSRRGLLLAVDLCVDMMRLCFRFHEVGLNQGTAKILEEAQKEVTHGWDEAHAAGAQAGFQFLVRLSQLWPGVFAQVFAEMPELEPDHYWLELNPGSPVEGLPSTEDAIMDEIGRLKDEALWDEQMQAQGGRP